MKKKQFYAFCVSILAITLFDSCHGDESNTCFSTSAHDQTITTTVTLWRGGIIPYQFDSSFPDDKKYIVLNAMNLWQEQSKAVYFRPKASNDDQFVTIKWVTTNNCNSSLGTKAGGSTINFSNYCRVSATYYHEFGHLIGMPHEHQRTDRYASLSFNDATIERISENFSPSIVNSVIGQIYKMEKIAYTNNTIYPDADTRIPFDRNSIMIYGSKLSNPSSDIYSFLTFRNLNLFTDNSCNTINAPNAISLNDAKKVQLLYPKVFILKNNTNTIFNNIRVRLKDEYDFTKVLFPNEIFLLTYNPSDGYYYYNNKIVQQLDFNNGSSSDDMNFEWNGANSITYRSSMNSVTTIASNIDKTPNLISLNDAIDLDGINGSSGMKFELSKGQYNDGITKTPSAIICSIVNFNNYRNKN